MVMKNHSPEEFEFDDVVTGRKRVIAMSILHDAQTPEEIAAVAMSLGEGTLGNDPIILQILSDYWDVESQN